MSLIRHDMRQFLQAGFRQEPETVYDGTCFFLFAVPSQLEAPMLSHDETMAVSILEQPTDKATDGPAYYAFRLLKKFKTFCSKRHELANQIWRHQEFLRSPTNHKVRYQHYYSTQQLEHARAQSRAMEQQCVNMNAILDQQLRVETDEEQLQVLRGAKEAARQLLEEALPAQRRRHAEQKQEILAMLRDAAHQQIIEQNDEIRRLDERARSVAVHLIQQAGTDTIIESSNALHACALNLEPVYLKMLMNLLSDDAKRRHAINAFDRRGMTPLMTAARSNNFESGTIGNRLSMCQAVLDLGADKNVVDATGLTALGRYRKAFRETNAIQASVGNPYSPIVIAEVKAMSSMEELLMPVQGPSYGDELVLEDSDGEEDEEEDLQEDNMLDSEVEDEEEEDDEDYGEDTEDEFNVEDEEEDADDMKVDAT